jgi:G protein-coupled glucose receptor regulating Gpa2 C-term
MFGTVVIYSLIFLSLHTKSKTFAQDSIRSTDSNPAVLKRAAKYMIIYPIVYVVCTLPLAGGRMASMTGMKIPYWWFCLAGSAITSCGWLDVLLYVMTRRVLVFSYAPPPRNDFGLGTLGWKHGGQGFWGTTTVIEGPVTNPRNRRKERDILGRRTPRPLRSRHSDEDYFAAPPSEGTVAVKTTVEVSSGPIVNAYASSDFSAIEMDDKPDRIRTPVTGSTSGP